MAMTPEQIEGVRQRLQSGTDVLSPSSDRLESARARLSSGAQAAQKAKDELGAFRSMRRIRDE